MRFRKKPVVIDAMRYTGDNIEAVFQWVGVFYNMPHMVGGGDLLVIHTLEGTLEARPGDWIIRGVKGEFYPCKPDIFEMTYEQVEDIAALVAGDLDP